MPAVSAPATSVIPQTADTQTADTNTAVAHSTELARGVDEYLAALATELGLSRNTLVAYRRDLRQYMAFLPEGVLLSRIERANVSAFVRHLHDRGLAPSTIARRIAAVRGLHRFLITEGMASENPTTLVASPRRGDVLPKALTVEEVFRLLDAPDTTTALGMRDKALLEFLYASGARVTEVVQLELLDVDLRDRTARVTGKGNKQRIVPLGSHALRAIEEFLPQRMALRQGRRDSGTVFVNARGGKLSRQGVWGIVRKHAIAAGIAVETVSPHVLRHSAATHMVEGGADLRVVQEMLGHASIGTTQVYTRVSPQHLHEVYVSSHPRP